MAAVAGARVTDVCREPSAATNDPPRLTVCDDVDGFTTTIPPANCRFQAAPAATLAPVGAPRSIVQASCQGSTAPGWKRSALPPPFQSSRKLARAYVIERTSFRGA